MTAQMGVPACRSCNAYAARMDAWGVAGCRERLPEIVAHLEKEAARLGWFKWAAVGVKAKARGLPLTAAGMADECIRRAAGEPTPQASTLPTAQPPGPPAVSLPGEWTRHLLYYVYPVSLNGVWQKNIDQLLERIDLFNGRRVVAVARQVGTVQHRRERRGQRPPHTVDPPAAVRERLTGHGCEFIELDNDGRLGEVAAFVPLMERVADLTGPGDATFYFHAKGVTRPVNHGVSVHPWSSLLYSANLDYWPVVADLLARHPIVGAFKTVGKAAAYPGLVHYSGTAFWFRNRDVFAKPNWRAVPQIWGGVESLPGVWFTPEEAGLIFYEEPIQRLVTGYHTPRLRIVLDQFAEWSNAHAAERRPGAVARPWIKTWGYE